MMRMIYIGLIALAVIMAIVLAISQSKRDLNPLSEIHQKIAEDFPHISHISPAELETRLASDNLLILDTRPLKEYKVSHISGAVQVDPDIRPEAFEAKFGDILKNKDVIVYCSVGRRSSILGDRLHSTALSAGAMSVQNMKGGLFGWHNDKRPLVNASGSTSGIHPYNSYWGRLIEAKENIRYQP